MKSQLLGLFVSLLMFAFCHAGEGKAQPLVMTRKEVSTMPSDKEEAWAWVFEPVGEDRSFGKRSLEYWVLASHRRQRLRGRGVEFWKKYSVDTHLWRLWLQSTVMYPPFYWMQERQGAQAYANNTPELAAIDTDAKRQWNDEYVAIRAAYWAAPGITQEQRAIFCYHELLGRMYSEPTSQAIDHNTNELAHLVNDVLDYGRQYPDAPELCLKGLAAAAFQLCDADPQLQSAYITALSLSNQIEWQLLAGGYKQVIALRGKPMDLKAITMQGKEIDLATLRGKVVLIDFWSLGCSSCIAAMPEIEAVYRRYRKSGFEVVGICVSFGIPKFTDIAKIEEVLRRQGVTWPTAVFAGEQDRAVREKYSIASVPVTFLLDRSGMLFSNDVRGQKLEDDIQLLLSVHTEEGRTTNGH